VAVSSSLDRTFRISIILKGLDGALEVIGGLLLIVLSPRMIDDAARALTQHELSHDPNDFIARHVLQAAHGLSHGSHLFAILYLLSHGLAKVVLVVALLRDVEWAYPGMIALLGAFIVYQLYRLVVDFTIGIALLTVFDVFVVWLTWREYQAKRVPAPG
jgi:uncharacterized membrane protein